MKLLTLTTVISSILNVATCIPVTNPSPASSLIQKRADGPPFNSGSPSNGNGKGGPILGGTNKQIDLQNPSNLGAESTDGGTVVNLKWSFSDSKTKIFPGGWTRTQVVTDLPASHDIASAQQHLYKGGIRELHWHKVAEWGYVYAGRVLVSAVDENGNFSVNTLEIGDIWYFPKGAAHTVQGLDEENEYLLVFDDGNFEGGGTTFNVDDWVSHTPKSILAQNFGVNETVFDEVPKPTPNILNGTVSTANDTGAESGLYGDGSFIFFRSQDATIPVPGGGGNLSIVDSRNFPISKTIAATIVSLEPGGLRELHWHPNAEEWLYFHQGTARATIFLGNANARTIDFRAGDTAVFPDNSGHYILNTSPTENLVWIEIYKSERVADISLTQWLALTPADIVATTLKVDIAVVEKLKREKQVLIKGVK